MNVDQLSALPTPFLLALRKDIQAILAARQPLEARASRRTFIEKLSLRPEESFDEYRSKLTEYNALENRSLLNLDQAAHTREKYFESLMLQDWYSVYPDTGGAEDFYVYAHVDPSERIFHFPKRLGGCFKGTPFYIGKGKGRRAWDLKRNEGHGTRLRHLIKQGWAPDDLVHVVLTGLTESKAYEVEAKLIYFFGTIYQLDRPFSTLLNLAVPTVPTFLREMEKMPLRKQYEKAREE